MLSHELNDILEDKNRLLTETYFELQRYFEQKYGNDSVVIMEIGSFFEVYEVDNDDIKIGKAKEIAQLLNIQLTKKNKSISENSEKNPLLAGVPSISFERYLDRLVQEKRYTIIIVRQKGQPPKVSRYISQILSPGTNFDYLQNHDENFIASLMVDVNKDIFSIGYAAIDVSTGKTFLYEAHGTSEDASFALDEIYHLLHIHNTSEVVLSFIDGVKEQKETLRYLEIEQHYHYSINPIRHEIGYQNELFKNVYQIQSLLSPVEHLDLERTPLTSEALSILIDFVVEHDYQIIQKLSQPKILDNRYFVYLGNSALEQLNIISKDKDEKTLLKLIDKSSTAMGKRLLKERLLHPIMDEKELKRRYNLSDKLKNHAKILDTQLQKIYDLERILRRIKLHRLHPFEVNFLHSSLGALNGIHTYLKDNALPTPSFEQSETKAFISEIEKTFDLNVTARFTSQTMSENLFLPGVDAQIDELIDSNRLKLNVFNTLMEQIDNLVKANSNRSEGSFVTLGFLEKEGYYLNISRNRFSMIENEFANTTLKIGDELFHFASFNIKKLTNNVKITSQQIDKLSLAIMRDQGKIVLLAKERYTNVLKRFEHAYSILIERTIQFIADLDVALNNAKLAQNFNYCRPQIVQTENDENFMQILSLRHPLIEMQEEHGIYVPNDVYFGPKSYLDTTEPDNVMLQANNSNAVYGVLLYGINSSGKSSLMKSIGISVVLAQAGFFVPASKMRFTLFDSIFTRIVSKDNLIKGLSTFAVEMLELKNIFNRGTKKSLILGDEISHGTETLSGVSIVASAIMKLAQKQSIFLFATHLHQLATMEEIENLEHIVNLHLGVEYDDKNDKLIFERKLQIGSGSSVYGLEFAKSLHMDREFLDGAEQIRKKLANDYSNVEMLVQKRKSSYNKRVYLTRCVICDQPVADVHHIKEQQSASKSGHIEHFHQNHQYNLIPLCKKHHKEIHDGKIRVNGFMMTSKGLELHYDDEYGK